MHRVSGGSRASLIRRCVVGQSRRLSRAPSTSFDEAARLRRSHLGPYAGYYTKPLYVVRGERQWLFDHDGRRFLDMFGGICTVSVGHCHPRVNRALQSQAEQLWHTSSIYTNPAPGNYAKKLTEKLPEHLSVCFFVNSGSEANDLAILMARLHTGRWELVTLRNAYHGASPFLMGATALSTWRYPTPTGFGFVQAACPDVYRGAWGGGRCRDGVTPIEGGRVCDCPSDCRASEMYANDLKDALRFSCQKAGPAGLLVEPIQGVGGIMQLPSGYLRRAYDAVHATGGLCISDEVQTGFGRLGTHYWGFEMHGVRPDIVTMAKSIGNGFPLAAVATTPEVASSMSKALHFNTFGGNPLACAVGSAVLDVIDEEGLQQNCRLVGERLLRRLRQLRSPLVGDVRGRGLMVGVECVADRASREPLESDRFVRLMDVMRDCGVLVGRGGFHGNCIRLQPPMCVTEADADTTADALEKALEAVA